MTRRIIYMFVIINILELSHQFNFIHYFQYLNGQNPAQNRQNIGLTMLQLHNKYRAQYGVSALSYDNELVAASQNWARKLCNEGNMYHSHTPHVGENLWYGYATSPNELPKWSTGVDAWMSEVKYYNWNYQPETIEEKTGHFTQCIWKSTTKVGCGKAISSDGLTVFLCCQYLPPGNVDGQYKKNVLRPKRIYA